MKSEKKKAKKKWIRPRHKFVRVVASWFIYPICRFKYGLRYKKFSNPDKKAYLILYNHQTGFDQFFVGMAFKEHLYYIASEDLFSNGFTSKLIKYLVAPIPIKKSTTDVRAVLDSKRVAKEGGSIAVAPEGNRTFGGSTGYIKPSIAQLAKALKLPVAIYKIEGGFGVQPRWSDVVRRGRINCYVSRVIEPEEYNALSDDELYDLICKELENDEGDIGGSYKHRKRAEYLERAMYYCPCCGFSEWKSHKKTITCKNCSTTLEYMENKELKVLNGSFPYKSIGEWYDAQCEFVIKSDLSAYESSPIYTDIIDFYQVIPYKKKVKLANKATISVYNDRYTIKGKDIDLCMPFDTISATSVLGKNKLNIYIGSEIYQLKPIYKGFNALKYMNIYYHSTNIAKGVTENAKLLGI